MTMNYLTETDRRVLAVLTEVPGEWCDTAHIAHVAGLATAGPMGSDGRHLAITSLRHLDAAHMIELDTDTVPNYRARVVEDRYDELHAVVRDGERVCIRVSAGSILGDDEQHPLGSVADRVTDDYGMRRLVYRAITSSAITSSRHRLTDPTTTREHVANLDRGAVHEDNSNGRTTSFERVR